MTDDQHVIMHNMNISRQSLMTVMIISAVLMVMLAVMTEIIMDNQDKQKE